MLATLLPSAEHVVGSASGVPCLVTSNCQIVSFQYNYELVYTRLLDLMLVGIIDQVIISKYVFNDHDQVVKS